MSTSSMSNQCSDIQSTISTYLDSELQGSDLHEFEVHVAECELCQVELERTQKEHRALQEHLRKPIAMPDLAMKRLHLALDEVDQEKRRSLVGKWRQWAFPSLASTLAAAALVAFIWKTNSQQGQTSEVASSEIAQAAARQHLQEMPLVVDTASASPAPVNPPSLSQSRWRLLGWAPSKLGRKRSASFVYELNSPRGRKRIHVHPISPSDLNLRSRNQVTVNGRRFWVDSAMGYTAIAYVSSSTQAYVFSSDMGAKELLETMLSSDIP